MAERKALVQVNGQVQELPAGDTLQGAGSGGGSVDAYYASPTSMDLGGTPSTSTSAFASKGNLFTVMNPLRVSGINYEIEAAGVGGAYEAVVAKLSSYGVSATITAIEKKAFTPTSASDSIQFDTPMQFVEGEVVFIGLTKTDIAGGADPLIRWLSGGTSHTSNPWLNQGANRGVRWTDNTLALGDSPTDLTNDWWATSPIYQRLNALVPVGGTTGQMLAKVDDEDYNSEWVDPPSGGGGGISEAPQDGKQYARKDAGWEEVAASGGGSGSPVQAPDLAIPFTNLDFNTGDLTGWTTDEGNPQVSATPRAGFDTSASGSHFLWGGTSNPTARISQEVAFDPTGYTALYASVLFMKDYADADQGTLKLEALDASDVVLGTILMTDNSGVIGTTSKNETMSIPAGTTKLKLTASTVRNSGNNANCGLDNIVILARAEKTYLTDAPSDDKKYVRKNGDWVESEAEFIDPNARSHWRLRGTNAGTFDGGALADLIFKDLAGNNVSIHGSTGTGTAGSEDHGGTAVLAFTEGSEMWAGANGAVAAGTSWLAFHFATPQRIVSFDIKARAGGNSNQMWDEWVLEWSDDGTNWTTLESYVDNTNWAGSEIKSFAVTKKAGAVDVQLIGENRPQSGVLTSSITITEPHGDTVIVGMAGQGDNAVDFLTINDVPGKLEDIHRVGQYDFISWFSFKGLTAGTHSYTLGMSTGGGLYRTSIFAYSVKHIGELSFDHSRLPTEDAILGRSMQEGSAIGVYTVDGSAVTSAGTMMEDSVPTGSGATFYTGAFSQNDPDGNVSWTIGETSSDNRTVATLLTIKPMPANPYKGEEVVEAINIELEGDEWQGKIKFTTKDVAAFSTSDDDFKGNIIRRLDLAAGFNITVEASSMKQACTFIPMGGGTYTFVEGTGVTIHSVESKKSTGDNYTSCALVPDEDDDSVFYLIGALT